MLKRELFFLTSPKDKNVDDISRIEITAIPLQNFIKRWKVEKEVNITRYCA